MSRRVRAPHDNIILKAEKHVSEDLERITLKSNVIPLQTLLSDFNLIK